MAKIISHQELDALLDVLADDLDRFTERCGELAEKWDAKGWALEISDPQSWRQGDGSDEDDASSTDEDFQSAPALDMDLTKTQREHLRRPGRLAAFHRPACRRS